MLDKEYREQIPITRKLGKYVHTTVTNYTHVGWRATLNNHHLHHVHVVVEYCISGQFLKKFSSLQVSLSSIFTLTTTVFIMLEMRFEIGGAIQKLALGLLQALCMSKNDVQHCWFACH